LTDFEKKKNYSNRNYKKRKVALLNITTKVKGH